MFATSITHSTTIFAINGSCPTVAPMPLSVIPCGQPKFNSNPCAPVSSTCLINSCHFSRVLSAINETIIALSGNNRTHSAISRRFTSSGLSDINSILLKPITRVLLKLTAEYLDETFFTCDPKVFHTTPPHPASNARSTLYFLSVGGALASQYGFGDLMPKKFADISAMITCLCLWFSEYSRKGAKTQNLNPFPFPPGVFTRILSAQIVHYCRSSFFSCLHRINDFLSPINTIASGKYF